MSWKEKLEEAENSLKLADITIQEKDAQIEKLLFQRNKTETIPGIVTIQLPILPANIANAERSRIYDAVEALGEGVEATEIDRERVMSELFDLIQRVISFVTADLAELLPGQDVSEHVQRFFQTHNDRHISTVNIVQEAG